MDAIQIWVSHYGYFGIFSLLMLGIVGIPIPDETLLTLSGYLIFSGTLQPVPAFLSAFLGCTCGISVSYAIGSTFGHRLLLKYGHYVHITKPRLDKAHNWFEKVGRWALLIGFFIPGFRHIVAILAGTSELQLWEFMLFAYSGALLWTASFMSIGYFFGNKWKLILHDVTHHTVLVSALILALIFLFYYIRAKIKNRLDSKDS